jgi:hypothetical protein
MLYVNVPDAVGVPLIVIVPPAKAAVTPAGNPVAVPIPVAPVVVCVIAVNAVLMHNVGVELAALAVLFGVTVIVAFAVLAVHVPLLIVQRSTYVPYALAVKVDVPEAALLNDPVPPLTILQAPVPTTGVLPPSDVLTSEPQIF